jgi:hypothetical protein
LPTAAQQSRVDFDALVATADIARITCPTIDRPPKGGVICAPRIAGKVAGKTPRL